MKTKYSKVLPVVVTVGLTACASFDPVPITDANRDSAKGVRYFETRPFVVVNKPFPLEAESVLVDARVSDDGKTINITGELDGRFKHFAEGDGVAASNVLILRSGVSPEAQGDEVDEKPPPAGDANDQTPADDQDDAGDPAADTPAPDESTETTEDADQIRTDEADSQAVASSAGQKAGLSTLTLTTDNTGMPLFPLNQYLTMIYLPDFEREFVISAKARFAIKNVEIVRGPGGTLLGLNATVDNSALLNPLMEAFGTIVSTSSDALVGALSPAGAATAVAQGEALAKEAPEELRGKLVTFRMHLIKFAAIGTYPVVKPSEIGAYAAVAGTSVLQPKVGYQIPYRYFQLLVAEALFTDDPLRSFALSEPDRGSAGAGDRGLDEPNCGNRLPSQQAAADQLVLMAGDAVEELRITKVKPDMDDDQCVTKVTFTATKGEGAAATALSAIEKAAVIERITVNRPGTEVKISDPT